MFTQLTHSSKLLMLGCFPRHISKQSLRSHQVSLLFSTAQAALWFLLRKPGPKEAWLKAAATGPSMKPRLSFKATPYGFTKQLFSELRISPEHLVWSISFKPRQPSWAGAVAVHTQTHGSTHITRGAGWSGVGRGRKRNLLIPSLHPVHCSTKETEISKAHQGSMKVDDSPESCIWGLRVCSSF